MKRIFRGFCINWFVIDPLHYHPSCSDLIFVFAEIFVFENRLPDSLSQGVVPLMELNMQATRWNDSYNNMVAKKCLTVP
jgi:hypothetical protein